MALVPYSDEVFPPATAQVGIRWNNRKSAEFSTAVPDTLTGSLTPRAALRTYPRWTWTWSFAKLHEDTDTALHAVYGFFLDRRGAYQTFRIRDTEDHTFNGQLIGRSNGTLRYWQVFRTYRNFIEPVMELDTDFGIETYNVGTSAWVVVSPSDYTVSNLGIITFSAVPPAGKLMRVNGTFYHRVRFGDDVAEINQFLDKLWNWEEFSMVSERGRG